MKNNFLLLTGRENRELIQFQDYFIHKDILSPFQKLQETAKKEINADIKIISSFRDFNRQKLIWNNKASGKRKILDDQENEINSSKVSKEELLNYILRFSAIPGLSRHHWGTDLDIFDANRISAKEVQLTHSECIGDGACATLHTWLDEKIVSHDSFGFFRPYNNDLGGISTEKWHISYAPLSTQLYESYTIEMFIENLKDKDVKLRKEILKNPEYYFKKYFKLITPP